MNHLLHGLKRIYPQVMIQNPAINDTKSQTETPIRLLLNSISNITQVISISERVSSKRRQMTMPFNIVAETAVRGTMNFYADTVTSGGPCRMPSAGVSTSTA